LSGLGGDVGLGGLIGIRFFVIVAFILIALAAPFALASTLRAWAAAHVAARRSEHTWKASTAAKFVMHRDMDHDRSMLAHAVRAHAHPHAVRAHPRAVWATGAWMMRRSAGASMMRSIMRRASVMWSIVRRASVMVALVVTVARSAVFTIAFTVAVGPMSAAAITGKARLMALPTMPCMVRSTARMMSGVVPVPIAIAPVRMVLAVAATVASMLAVAIMITITVAAVIAKREQFADVSVGVFVCRA
jgi:hypothetical protein